jgi:hypothetical protein
MRHTHKSGDTWPAIQLLALKNFHYQKLHASCRGSHILDQGAIQLKHHLQVNLTGRVNLNLNFPK